MLHSAADAVPAAFIRRSRDYSDAEWATCTENLAARGLLTPAGAITEAGRRLKARIESVTDTLALSALAELTDVEVERMFRALTPITRLVVAGGDLPAETPMGLRRDELDDDSAGLG